MSYNMRTLSLLILFYLFFVSTASASVVMHNTRIILNDSYQKRIQLTNNDENDNVVQMWTTTELDKEVKFGTKVEPFIVSPQVFKIKSKEGQSISLNYIGNDLPQDRESVFYLHMLQIPPISDASKSTQQIVVLQKTEVKIFYRPKITNFNVNKIDEYLTFKKNSEGTVTCYNNSPFHINIIGGSITSIEEKADSKLHSIMIKPYSNYSWNAKNGKSNKKYGSKVVFTYVNDQGAFIKKEAKLH